MNRNAHGTDQLFAWSAQVECEDTGSFWLMHTYRLRELGYIATANTILETLYDRVRALGYPGRIEFLGDTAITVNGDIASELCRLGVRKANGKYIYNGRPTEA